MDWVHFYSIVKPISTWLLVRPNRVITQALEIWHTSNYAKIFIWFILVHSEILESIKTTLILSLIKIRFQTIIQCDKLAGLLLSISVFTKMKMSSMAFRNSQSRLNLAKTLVNPQKWPKTSKFTQSGHTAILQFL